MRARNASDGLSQPSDRSPRGALPIRNILQTPLPHLGVADGLLLRATALIANPNITAIHGLEHIRAARDPFILVANHSTRRESLFVPAMLFLHRGGQRIHFCADWNFRLIPGVDLIYRRAQVITVTRKSARPRFLNILKPLFADPQPTFERARSRLQQGHSIGMFPEGTINRDPGVLLRGRRGAARLSLETGAPVIPLGIRFPHADLNTGAHLSAPMELRIGPALRPPGPIERRASICAVSAWHSVIMNELARLSGKSWLGTNGETKL